MKIRFKENFRERMPEWFLALGILFWGIICLLSPTLFQISLTFKPLLVLMDQVTWGLAAVVVGSIRLIFLIINGSWRPSAHIRALGSAGGALLWGGMFISTLNLNLLVPTTSIYFILMILDLISLWFAAGDAKIADLSVKGII